MPNQSSRFDERWLRRIFVKDWGLKLLALAITLVLWFVVSGREVERELVVEPQLAGRPAPGYEVKEVLVAPAKIRVTGAASHVNALDKAQTGTISIEGRRESFDMSHTAVHISDPGVGVLDRVNVHVTIVADENSRPQSQGKN
ncbi:MAG TPA: YbbR-like domain-containing protein [Pyrinomonadaceae bacterium]|nr:YbbR-like domain-containing protein [Pyrinomonadaceae bacterium]